MQRSHEKAIQIMVEQVCLSKFDAHEASFLLRLLEVNKAMRDIVISAAGIRVCVIASTLANLLSS